MAANDIVEMTQDLHGEELRQLDLVLEKAGAVTLSQMRDRGYRLVLKLLSRKTLSKEEDIYLLKAVVENQDERFSESDLRKAEEILERSADAT